MDQKNNIKYFNKSNLLIILLLIIFSSKILDITFDIFKSIFYIVGIIYLLNYINPSLVIQIKEISYKFIKLLFSNTLSQNTYDSIISYINPNINSDTNLDINPKDLKIIENRNINNSNNTNNRTTF